MTDHWSDELLGTPWIQGQLECFDFVLKIVGARTGRASQWAQVAAKTGRAGRMRLLETMAEEGLAADAVDPTELQELDVLTMRDLGATRPSHVGAVIDFGAGPEHVLHSTEECGAVRHRIRDLGLIQLEPVGYWRLR